MPLESCLGVGIVDKLESSSWISLFCSCWVSKIRKPASIHPYTIVLLMRMACCWREPSLLIFCENSFCPLRSRWVVSGVCLGNQNTNSFLLPLGITSLGRCLGGLRYFDKFELCSWISIAHYWVSKIRKQDPIDSYAIAVLMRIVCCWRELTRRILCWFVSRSPSSLWSREGRQGCCLELPQPKLGWHRLKSGGCLFCTDLCQF